jgi:hypothetical protein
MDKISWTDRLRNEKVLTQGKLEKECVRAVTRKEGRQIGDVTPCVEIVL